MPVTVDCGENKHDLCTGTGRTAYLIPQESRSLDEPPFNCGCTCHHKADAKVPCRECQPLVGEETFGDVVLTDHVMDRPTPEPGLVKTFHDLPASAFPFTVEFSDEEGAVVEVMQVDGPGAVVVPALGKRYGPVTARIRWPDGSVTDA